MIEQEDDEDEPAICVCIRCGTHAQAIRASNWRTANGGRDPICPHCAPRAPALPKVHSTLVEWRDRPVMNNHGSPVEVRTVFSSAAGVKLVIWTAAGMCSAKFDTEQAAADAVRTGSAVFALRPPRCERKPTTCEAAGALRVATLGASG